MQKRFNTAGKCYPDIHYMVNIDRQVEAAAVLVRRGDYFCINRGRQFGKTTTLEALKHKLTGEGYAVFSLSFEGLEDSLFTELRNLLGYVLQVMSYYVKRGRVKNLCEDAQEILHSCIENGAVVSSFNFRTCIDELCEKNRVALLIDEVDAAGNHIEFIKFLGLLRDMYLNRREQNTFQTVVLAGVYDIKNLKLKIRPEELHQYNSPWNIAVPFDADMSLQADGISDMLAEYKADHSLQFDEHELAKMIYDYTSGYPFLVSRICQIIDEDHLEWSKEGVLKSVNSILMENNTLFDDMVKKLDDYPDLKNVLKSILYCGDKKPYLPYERYMQLARMFSFIKIDRGLISITCRIMETCLYNMFLFEEKSDTLFNKGSLDKPQFIHDGIIDMPLLLSKFCLHFNDIFRMDDGSMDAEFIEKQGRKQFLLYLRPIINGIGNYYVEAETRDETRTDVVVDYLGHQYIIELKIWHGDSYNQKGEAQLAEYLDLYHQTTGYLVSFSFNKSKKSGVIEHVVGDKKVFEAIV